jgi:hypothetical protein
VASAPSDHQLDWAQHKAVCGASCLHSSSCLFPGFCGIAGRLKDTALACFGVATVHFRDTPPLPRLIQNDHLCSHHHHHHQLKAPRNAGISVTGAADSSGDPWWLPNDRRHGLSSLTKDTSGDFTNANRQITRSLMSWLLMTCRLLSCHT